MQGNLVKQTELNQELWASIRGGKFEQVKELIAKGANVNVVNTGKVGRSFGSEILI